jgi:hypothetical protein
LTIFLKDDGIEDPMDEVVVKRALWNAHAPLAVLADHPILRPLPVGGQVPVGEGVAFVAAESGSSKGTVPANVFLQPGLLGR